MNRCLIGKQAESVPGGLDRSEEQGEWRATCPTEANEGASGEASYQAILIDGTPVRGLWEEYCLDMVFYRWSLTSIQLKLVKIGAKIISHSRMTVFQMAEVAVPEALSSALLECIRCPGRRADLIDTGVVHMKAETTANDPQASSKTVLSSTQREAALRKRAASGIAPRKIGFKGV